MVLLLSLFAVDGRTDGREVHLVEDGRSAYTIVISAEASPSEKHAAAELRHFLREISGAELPIAVEEHASPERMIVLGDGRTLRALEPSIDLEDLGGEGFVIKTSGPHLVIAGGRLRGTMYGVYTFLEEVLGCRWYTSKVSRIPRKPSIAIGELHIRQKPDFEYREPFYTDAFDADWAARNKTNGNRARLDEARGGKVAYHHPFVHTFKDLVPLSKYADEHPEFYSLVDGKRKIDRYTQLCLTNPQVLEIATREVMRWIRRRPEAIIYSVSQNDWRHYCQCEDCRAVYEEEGSPSGLVLRFVNAVAERVEKRHPEKLIDTLAYQWTEKAPKITRPRPNVRIRLCPFYQCQYHPYEECPKNAGFVENLRDWSRITNNLYIWHYNTNFWNYLIPFPDLDQLTTSIPLYKRTGVKGVFTQGNFSAGGGGFMDELKAYLIARMLWDTSTDPKAVVEDFLQGYYGRAGRPVGEFLDLLHRRVRRQDIHGGIYGGVDTPLLNPRIMSAGERLLDEAERLADGPDVLQRVRRIQLSLEYVNVMRLVGTASSSGTAEEKASALERLESFIEKCEAFGITEIRERRPIREHVEQLANPLRG